MHYRLFVASLVGMVIMPGPKKSLVFGFHGSIRTTSSLLGRTRLTRSHTFTSNDGFPTILASRRLDDQNSEDGSEWAATPLQLSKQDLERFAFYNQLRQPTPRTTIMPILILDSMLPNQKLALESSEPNFWRLVQYCLKRDGRVGVLGTHPTTGRPLSRGVVIRIRAENVRTIPKNRQLTSTLAVQAEPDRIEIQSSPWLDDSGSFYLSRVQWMDSQHEPPLSSEQHQVALELSQTIPKAMEEWSTWLFRSGKVTRETWSTLLESLGPLPDDFTRRAFWVAAAVNPLPPLGVCLDIRPAMLSCNNDYERIILACQALQSSIDHLSGKRRLM